MASRGSKGTSTTTTATVPPDTSATITQSSSFLSRKKEEIINRSMALLTRSLDQCLEKSGKGGGGGAGRATKKRVAGGGGGKKFACPFCKHDPIKYRSVKTCCGPGWINVHRVKEHVYRRHSLNNFCPRCFEHFEKPELLKNHQRADVSCKLRERAPSGITEEQEKLLRTRAKSGLSEEAKWEEMYKIIFPGEKVPSPYYETDSSSSKPGTSRFASHDEFRELLRVEVPRLALPLVVQYVNELFEEFHERVGKRTVEIAQEIETRVLRIFHFQEEQTSALPSLGSVSPRNSSQNACEPSSGSGSDMSKLDDFFGEFEDDPIAQDVLSDLPLSTILDQQLFSFDSRCNVDSAYCTSSSSGIPGSYGMSSVGYSSQC
ncbi:hypothetical protein N0V88_000631 [Collariella sp. IMI 366227]|nr:hypothetical protein N0V88_000631 [Collariella sp. IMI 366227]